MKVDEASVVAVAESMSVDNEESNEEAVDRSKPVVKGEPSSLGLEAAAAAVAEESTAGTLAVKSKAETAGVSTAGFGLTDGATLGK